MMFPPCPPQIRAAHRQKKAIIYVRQSSAAQVNEHIGSTAAQLELAELPHAWDWPESRIVTIDADQGMSGTTATKRTGFQILMDLIERDEVGIVLARDISRLARNLLDAARFLDAAKRAGILIYANGRVYDAAADSDSDEFSLQLESLLAVRDNAARVRTFATARAAKARQGHAVSTPPVGYVRATRGKWVKDPDPTVRDAVQRVFELYPRLGSLNNVVKYFRAEGLTFPRRIRGEVRLGPLNAAQLDCILRNPIYTGSYVYRRFRTTSATESAPRRQERRSPADWITVPNHHEPYVSQEAWARIQELLAAQRPRMRPLAGKGNALLQGLVRCGSCDRWMHTHYWGRDGQARTASYICRRVDGPGHTTHRVALRARLLDSAVAREVLAALTPVEIGTALEVLQAEQKQQSAAERMRRRQLQRAEDAVEDARQAYLQADPANQLVKADLGALYEAALQRRDRLKDEITATVSSDLTLKPEDGVKLVQLTSDVPELWSASTTTPEDRKRILRALVSQVVVRDATKDAAELEIVWAGGLRQPLRVLLPRGVLKVVAERAGHEASVPKITEELRAAGVVTTTGRPISANVVRIKLRQAGIPSARQQAWNLAHQLIHKGLKNGSQRSEILRQLNEHTGAQLGLWTPQRVADVISDLRHGPPPWDPLPGVLPAELEKQRVLSIIAERFQAGDSYEVVAAHLDALGLKPQRGTVFNRNIVYQLHLRWLRRRSAVPGREDPAPAGTSPAEPAEPFEPHAGSRT